MKSIEKRLVETQKANWLATGVYILRFLYVMFQATRDKYAILIIVVKRRTKVGLSVSRARGYAAYRWGLLWPFYWLAIHSSTNV
jgi:hypothetical protein